MSDPLAILPLALAAAGGGVDGHPAAALVAAGFTLLQRSTPLVRALAGRRSAILLPASPAFFVALAASDGRGAVLIDPDTDAAGVARLLSSAEVGALFTVRTVAVALPSDLPVVWLDAAPRSAQVEVGGVLREVDLGTHFGLALEGDRAAVGRDEECLLLGPPSAAELVSWSHRTLLAETRQAVAERRLTPAHRARWQESPVAMHSLIADGLAPLLAGGTVVTD